MLIYPNRSYEKMPVIGDSYMGMFLPADISERIGEFIGGKLRFPIIRNDEIMGVFYLFGKDHGIKGQTEILSATNLAKRTIEQLGRDVRSFHNMPNKLETNSVREDYMKRVFQISIEIQQVRSDRKPELTKRIGGDPAILTSCFTQHIAFYQNDYFFEFFQPLRKEDLPLMHLTKLEGRMLLLGFNVKNRNALPYENSITPFIHWLDRFI
jgi:hypothetical protein